MRSKQDSGTGRGKSKPTHSEAKFCVALPQGLAGNLPARLGQNQKEKKKQSRRFVYALN